MSGPLHDFLAEEVVLIELSKDEALVLHEFLSAVGGAGRAQVFEHRSEELLAREIAGLIRAELPEAKRPDYEALLAEARHRLSQPQE